VGYDLTTIAVSGAQGYLGSRVVNKLTERGLDVLRLTHKDNAGNNIACDLTNPDDVSNIFRKYNIECLIHCAEVVPKEIGQYDNEQLYIQNIEMLKNLVAQDIDRFVYCSSMTVYGNDSRGIINESNKLNATGAYARSKIKCEEFLNKSQIKQLAIARIPGLFGSGRTTGLIYNSIKAFVKKNMPSIGGHPHAWSAMHVEDGAEILVRMATFPLDKNITCNIGYGMPQSVYKLLNDLMALMQIDELEIPRIDDNWLCLDINRQLKHFGCTPNNWYERLTQEIAVVKET